MSDFQSEINDVIGAPPGPYTAEHDLITENRTDCTRPATTATVKGKLFRLPARDRTIRRDAENVCRFTDGPVSEETAGSATTIMSQVGAFNPPWLA